MSKITLTFEEFTKLAIDNLPGQSSFTYEKPEFKTQDNNDSYKLPDHVDIEIKKET